MRSLFAVLAVLAGCTPQTQPQINVFADHLRTHESGLSAAFTMTLSTQPLADVVVVALSDNPLEGKVEQPEIRFTPDNWSSPHVVTITGVDDFVIDGDQYFHVLIGAANIAVDVINADDDMGGLRFEPTPLEVAEGGQASFQVRLQTRPRASVEVSLAVSDPQRISISPSQLAFEADRWDIAQTITVTTAQNTLYEGPVEVQVGTLGTHSNDRDYQNLKSSLVVRIVDDELPPVIVDAPMMRTSWEDDTHAGWTFTVRLLRLPTAPVVVPISSNRPDEARVEPSQLTFNDQNWNVPVTVSVFGVHDQLDDGNQPYVIGIGAALSADPFYSGFDAADSKGESRDADYPGVELQTLPKHPHGGTSESDANNPADCLELKVRLRVKPTGLVTLALKASDPTEGVVSPSGMTFDANSWNSYQTTHVCGVDDQMKDGDYEFKVTVIVAASLDPKYPTGAPLSDLTLVNKDDD